MYDSGIFVLNESLAMLLYCLSANAIVHGGGGGGSSSSINPANHKTANSVTAAAVRTPVIDLSV